MAGRGGKRPGAGRKKLTPEAKARQKAQRLVDIGLALAAQRHAEKALETLANSLDDDGGANRIAAAKEILDRAYGKAAQTTTHKGDEDSPLRTVTDINFNIIDALKNRS